MKIRAAFNDDDTPEQMSARIERSFDPRRPPARGAQQRVT